MNNSYLSQIGLANRAGKVVSGEANTLQSIRTGKAKLLLIAEDAAQNTKKKFSDKGRSYDVPVIEWGSRSEYGKALGKADRAVLAITDEGFAELIRKSLQNL